MTSAGRGTAVVSGAASGIGAASVSALAGAGFEVVGVDLAACPPGLEDVDRVHWVQGDVTAPHSWDRAVELSAGPVDAFVACAADVTVQPFLETPASEWRRLFEINVMGVVLGMQALVPGMVERRRGAVVITCSVNSMFVEEELAAYSASKSALLSLTRTAALEHARHGLRINAVCPGIVDTPLLRKHVESLPDPAAASAAMRGLMPTGAMTRPEEVAALIRFLATEEASGLSGSAVVVDGGLTTTYGFGG